MNYQKFNNVTIKNRYPFLLINKIMDRVNGAKVFNKINLKDAYYRIKIRQGDK